MLAVQPLQPLRSRGRVRGKYAAQNAGARPTRTFSRHHFEWMLVGAAGQINGTNAATHNVDRVGVGTGVYSLGAPRQLEFGLRITF